jgi:6-phosphogluconolactonase
MPGRGGKRGHVEVFGGADDVMRAAAEGFVDRARAAIGERGRFAVALSGGSTPRALYALLAAEPYAARVDWDRVDVFWSDERAVGPDDPASNYGMARAALLDHVAVPAANVHRIRGEDAPERAAAAYETELRHEMPDGRLDLVLLGMGADGHTASLFPGTAAIRENERWVVAHHVAAVAAWRNTLTPVAINSAREDSVSWCVAGKKPRRCTGCLTVRTIPTRCPPRSSRPRDGDVRWLVDAAAAMELEGS